MEKKTIGTSKAPAAIGAYSQAVVIGDMIFTAGQIGLEPDTGALAGPGISSQTKQVLQNLEAVLAEAGASFADVVKTTIYIKHLEDFPTVNEIYAQHFTSNFPARSTVQVAGLPLGALVEMDMVAHVTDGRVSF